MMRSLFYARYIALALVLLAGSVRPGTGMAQVGVQATLDSTEMLVGGKRTIRLRVDYAPGVRLLDPDLSALDTTEAIELLRVTEWDTVRATDRAITIEKDLYFTAWDSGYFEIAPIMIPYEIPTRSDTLYTNTLPLRVNRVPQDTTLLMPLKPIIQEPVRTEDFIPYIIGLLAAIFILAITWLWWRKKKRTEKVEPPPVVIPPHEIALKKYEALQQAQLWQKGQVKAFHTQLTYILREYLENRYGILALESTSREIAAQLKDHIPEELRQETTQLLNTSDMVKFAKATPPEEVHDQLLAQAIDFIHTTTPEEAIDN